jgi:hypothetical protein
MLRSFFSKKIEFSRNSQVFLLHVAQKQQKSYYKKKQGFKRLLFIDF